MCNLRGHGLDIEKSFSITTLGCKLNQFESECIRQELIRLGWECRDFGTKVSFSIINTCTVTGKTDSRCRNAVRRAKRASPENLVVVTGCYAEVTPKALEMMSEVDFVLGNSKKASIPFELERLAGSKSDLAFESSPEKFLYGIDDFNKHSRAFIKVQEGCDSSCTYCIIPRARGSSRSISRDDVIAQVVRLENNGIEEVVLTGIHIGRYGYDLPGAMKLDTLISDILSHTDKVRLRLSSIEMNEVSDGILSLMVSSERLASHLHIPLQSGDEDILKAMNRPYTATDFRAKIDKVKKSSMDISIGTDIITGFPGETDSRFRNTRNFLKALPFDYFHVFAFSRRSGTPADTMNDQVSPETKKSRSRKLIRLGKKKKFEFMRSRTGKRDVVLVQRKAKRYSRFLTGLTGNYCEVSLKAPSSKYGKLCPVDITHYSRGRLYGTLSE
ncbi:MAG: tRNA (N(6)-L-threonylcarbamoyladenosine(37)-C(2))-methylthiotransferase MtaB [Candidatus Krumholzibacteria bacterium]|nr:tRNA (N(6)-L-threonylcarbamoyladenosine(37)-C(2))-methylthiotransferase MtaB [Candidatus Krumholzibacteria bacterium]